MQLHVLQTADTGYYREIWKKISAHPDNLVSDPEQGPTKARNEDYIYITEVKYPTVIISKRL